MRFDMAAIFVECMDRLSYPVHFGAGALLGALPTLAEHVGDHDEHVPAHRRPGLVMRVGCVRGTVVSTYIVTNRSSLP